MKAAIFHAVNSPLGVEDVVVDKPRPREVLLRVAASSLCHSDLHHMKGEFPHPTPSVLGHEAAGIVEAVGSEVASLKPGDHVVCCASVFCGTCDPCLSSSSNRCSDRPHRPDAEPSTLSLANGTRLMQRNAIGGFAEQMLVHENGMVKIPRELALDRAALLGCGVMTGLGAVFNSAEVRPGSSVVVIGCGGVGLNIVQGARIAGAEKIIAVDLSQQKLDLARELGATHTLLSDATIVEAVRDASQGGVDYAFEVVGRPEIIEMGVRMLRPGGLMTIVGVTRPEETFALGAVPMLWNEWRIQGSRLGSGPFKRDIPRFGALYMSGRLNLDALISERIQLGDINAGFDAMEHGAQARSVILFDDVMAEAARRA